ncbi:MAG TPA: hypothetical protein PKD85_13330 [Saprospiraceae bacterium]|nr:hypothetical protein [Saprospiraceae bacterium]
MNITSKFSSIICILFFFHSLSHAQFYVKGGVLVNHLGSELKNLDIYKGKASYTLGMGQEISVLKFLVLDAGFNFMNIKNEIVNSNQLASNSVLALPFLIKLRPVKQIDFGAGLMPSISLSRDKTIFEKAVDLSGVLNLSLNVHKNFSLDAAYYAGFIPYNELNITNASGDIVKMLENKLQFYTLGVKIKFGKD